MIGTKEQITEIAWDIFKQEQADEIERIADAPVGTEIYEAAWKRGFWCAIMAYEARCLKDIQGGRG